MEGEVRQVRESDRSAASYGLDFHHERNMELWLGVGQRKEPGVTEALKRWF